MPQFSFAGMEIWRAVFPLRLSFSHHLASRDVAETLVVVAIADDGTRGCGQALPRPYLTGETLDSAAADIRERWWPALAGMRFDGREDSGRLLDAFRPMFMEADSLRKNASYAAVETAALDAASRRLGIAAIPANAAATTPPPPLVGVVPACSRRKAAWLTRTLRWLGYRRFKVKVGLDADADSVRLEAVRRAAGPAAWLAVDANQAWAPEEAEKRMPGLRRFGVTVVEEPLAKGYAGDADFSRLEKLWGCEIMADESLCTLADAGRQLEKGRPSWWNLRLGKNGGCCGIANFSELSRRHGVKVYGGVLVGETSLLAAAGRAALVAGGAECLEYGFPRIFLKGDPFRGGPGGFSGLAHPLAAGATGFGVTLSREKLERKAVLLWRDGIGG